MTQSNQQTESASETILLAGGCFWCIESVFNQIRGVVEAISGYANGKTLDPTYEAVCTGQTGHNEVVQVTFDPQQIDLATILTIFYHIHDPTQHNRQGEDQGTQYRSGIYYFNHTQYVTIQNILSDVQRNYSQPLVTEIAPATVFYPAEAYHQGYFLRHPERAYCQIVVAPKFKQAQSIFADRWKSL